MTGKLNELIPLLKAKTLDAELAQILGTMCFQCGAYAQMLRHEGHEIPQKAEAEQAAVIAWQLSFYVEHGDQWKAKVSEYVKAHIARFETEAASSK